MRDEKVIVYEEQPEEAFDRLQLSLPVPRLPRLPVTTRDHLRAARREWLLAWRSLLDAAIERLEEKPPRKAQHIPVQ